MTRRSDFWDALAPHLAAIENSFLDLPSIRRMVTDIRSPVLVVGAGQGLIVAELQQQGLKCDGVDFSEEMIRYARLRRGLSLVRADAKALPYANAAYKTIIYATGVIDFMSDDAGIRAIVNEGRRIVERSGSLFVAFYKSSAATEDFLTRLGLLRDGILHFRELMEIYRLTPAQTLAWVAKRAKTGRMGALRLALGSWAYSSWQEKRNGVRMQRIFAKAKNVEALIEAAPEKQVYRTEIEIRNLFMRLSIPVREFESYGSCHVATI